MCGKSIFTAVSVIASLLCATLDAQTYSRNDDDDDDYNKVIVKVETFYMNGEDEYSSGIYEFCPVEHHRNSYYPPAANKPLVCRDGDYIYLRPIGTSAAKRSGYYVVDSDRYISEYQDYKIPFKKGDDDTDIVFEIKVEKPYNASKTIFISVELYFDK